MGMEDGQGEVRLQITIWRLKYGVVNKIKIWILGIVVDEENENERMKSASSSLDGQSKGV